MKECPQQQYLLEYVDEPQSSSRSAWLDAHLDDCGDCRDFVQACTLFRETLGSERSEISPDHPNGDALARFVIDTESLGSFEARRIRRHVDSCGTCLSELGLVRAALEEARGSTMVNEVQDGRRSTPRRRGLYSVAAASFFFVVSLVGAHLLFRTPQESAVSGRIVEGNQTIRAAHSITMSDTHVRAGASLGVESGEMVSFGEGFVVDSEANLFVSIKKGNGS